MAVYRGAMLLGLAISASAAGAAEPVVVVQASAGGAVVVRQGGFNGQYAEREVVDPQDNRERFLLLTPGGPLVVEATMTIDAAPFRAPREKLLDEWLTDADTDKDGKFTWPEAVANPRFLAGRLMYLVRNEGQKTAFIKASDTNQDGIVDRGELRRLIGQQFGGATFNVSPNFNGVTQPDVRELLDTDKDGNLSADEFKTASERLKSRDADDNDLVTLLELGGGGYQQFQTRGRAPMATSAVLLGPTANLENVFAALMQRYQGKDGGIDAAKFALAPKLFEALDADKNGRFEKSEAAGLNTAAPQIEIEAHLGKSGELPSGVTLKSLAAELGDATKLVSSASGLVTITLPGVKVELAAAPQNQQFAANFEQTASATLTRLDADKNGYLEKKEFEGNNQAYAQQFEGWDLNQDGKVFAEEIKGFFEKQQAPLQSQISASASEQGNSLFAALDATGDGRLSLREMRTAADRLASLDANKDGRITSEEIPSTLTLTLNRGYAQGNVRFSGNAQAQVRGASATAAKGPDWFTRMDRNGDGDITLREFLGTPEQFKKLDRDADGFLTPDEAQ